MAVIFSVGKLVFKERFFRAKDFLILVGIKIISLLLVLTLENGLNE